MIESRETTKLIAVEFTAFVRLIIRAITTWKVLVTQSSNIVHCNRYTQKPVCAKFQGFSNTFSLLKFTSFIFLSEGVCLLHQCQCCHCQQQQQKYPQNVPYFSIDCTFSYRKVKDHFFGTRIKYHYKARYKLYLTNCLSDKLLTTTTVISMPKKLYARTFKWFQVVLPGQKSFVCVFLRNKYGSQIGNAMENRLCPNI